MSNVVDTSRLIYRESRLRSLFKAISYRIISIIGTGILSWVVTKDFGETVSLIITIQIFLTVLYYSWERVWNRINWGKRMDVV